MRRRKAGAGSMATTSCPSSFKVSGSPTGSKSPPTPRPRNPKPPPPDPSGHHQDSAIAPEIGRRALASVLDDRRILPQAPRPSSRNPGDAGLRAGHSALAIPVPALRVVGISRGNPSITRMIPEFRNLLESFPSLLLRSHVASAHF